MSTKHTSGPWELVDHSWSCVGIYAGSKGIAALNIANEAAEENEDDLSSEMWANARLIAAAPDLLEALILLEHEMVESGNAESRDYGWKPAIEKTRAAIAKATGEKA